ncbi:LTA synthase family protein [Cohnella yongneupensis]|uniref:LTA synthase family protein n=1 Tax=Cohnella yongneupensis TaxID=425006 RepID=A0ABW0R0V3_9BACL
MKAAWNSFVRTPFVLTFILLMLKMMLFRHFIFENIQLTGLLADAAAILTILCLFELIVPSKWKPLGHGIVNAIISSLLFAATVYFSYYGTVPIYTALYGLDQVGQIHDSVQSSIQTSNYLLFIDVAALAIVGLWSLLKGIRIFTKHHIAKPMNVLISLIAFAVISGGFIRANNDIPNELVQAESLGFLNYELTAGIKVAQEDGVSKETIAAIPSMQQNLEEEFAKDGGTSEPNGQAPAYFGVAKGKNVIVIQMEAFQNFAINMSIDGQVITPNLNALIGDSFYFPHFFQTIGQGNTSDAEFMSNTSIYPTGVIAMSTGYGDREIPSMPRLLKQDNYVSNTFHINDVTFWDRNKLYPALGFTKYYDKPSFNNDKFNAFGASDMELYRVGLEKLTDLHEAKTPFYAQFVTASSHHPFKVPKALQRIKVPASMEGTQLGNYLIALNYTDYALGEFIKGLKEKGMWDDTILVAYGDHFGLQPKDNDPAWVSEQLGITYQERVSRFNIPLFIHVPGVKGETKEQVGGQVDIMPTVANLLGISFKDRNYTAFGHDLLNVEHNVIGMRYYLPTGSFFNDDVLFVPGKGFDDGSAIDLKTLQPVADFSKYRKDYDYILSLEQLSDQYVKSLPQRQE